MFRQLVNAVSRKASAATLPSDGLRLNASKSESMLVMQCCYGCHHFLHIFMNMIFRSLVPRAARQAVGLSRVELWWSLDPGETIQMFPGIVCDESGLCAAIH